MNIILKDSCVYCVHAQHVSRECAAAEDLNMSVVLNIAEKCEHEQVSPVKCSVNCGNTMQREAVFHLPKYLVLSAVRSTMLMLLIIKCILIALI